MLKAYFDVTILDENNQPSQEHWCFVTDNTSNILALDRGIPNVFYNGAEYVGNPYHIEFTRYFDNMFGMKEKLIMQLSTISNRVYGTIIQNIVKFGYSGWKEIASFYFDIPENELLRIGETLVSNMAPAITIKRIDEKFLRVDHVSIANDFMAFEGSITHSTPRLLKADLSAQDILPMCLELYYGEHHNIVGTISMQNIVVHGFEFHNLGFIPKMFYKADNHLFCLPFSLLPLFSLLVLPLLLLPLLFMPTFLALTDVFFFLDFCCGGSLGLFVLGFSGRPISEI